MVAHVLELSNQSSENLRQIYDLNSTCKCNRRAGVRERANWYILPWPNHTQLQTEALMGSYNQLTEAQRYQIYALKKVGRINRPLRACLGFPPRRCVEKYAAIAVNAATVPTKPIKRRCLVASTRPTRPR